MKTKRYLSLPTGFHHTHEVCDRLLQQLEEFLINDAYSELRVQQLPFEGQKKLANEHFLDFLLRTGNKNEHDQIIRLHITYALISDVCYFLREALECSLMSRLTVSFALLRKPFVYSLPVMLRLIYEEDFIQKFSLETDFDPVSIHSEDRNELIEASLQDLTSPVFSLEDLNAWIFDKTRPDSLTNISEKALHLSTTRNRNEQTTLESLNFIFSTPQHIYHQWEYLYSRLPALLLYLVQVTEVMIFSAIHLDDQLLQDRIAERAEILVSNKQDV